MSVLYVHLLRFPLQRRLLETPSLAGRAVVLWEEDRGVRRVAFASAPAQKVGIRPGMTLTAASALEPELVPLPYAPEAEAQALASLGEALLCLGPRFQLSSPDGLWLDAAAAPLAGGAEGLCTRVLALCTAHGYRAQVAVAKDLFTSRALARYGSSPSQCVGLTESAELLRPLPLSALELQDSSMHAQLAGLGLRSLGEVAALPAGALVARFGTEGMRIHRLCRGQDDRLLVPHVLPETLQESVELDWPAESQEPLLFALKTLLDRLCARLFGRKLCAVRIRFQLRLDSRDEVVVPLTLARPTSQAKLLLELGRHRISDLTLQSAVSGVGVEVEEACVDPGQQLGLGDTPEGDAPLEVVLSRLSTTLGEEALFSAGLAEQHRPERAYAKGAFRPPVRASGLLGEAAAVPEPVWADRLREQRAGRAGAKGKGTGRGERCQDSRRAGQKPDAVAEATAGAEGVSRERPSRLFTKPASLDAELDEGGGLRAARLLGRRRKVTAVAGPERLVGEWWESAFCRDYYRVHFEGLGPVWIFRDERDGRFYLQGMFD